MFIPIVLKPYLPVYSYQNSFSTVWISFRSKSSFFITFITDLSFSALAIFSSRRNDTLSLFLNNFSAAYALGDRRMKSEIATMVILKKAAFLTSCIYFNYLKVLGSEIVLIFN